MQTEITFVENTPLDTRAMAELFSDRSGMYLAWPAALWPFDHHQWRRALAPDEGHRSYFVCAGASRVGHAALRMSDTPGEYIVSFLYLAPSYRGQGIGGRTITYLEEVAARELNADRLRLVVRSFNTRAWRCYTKAGFTQASTEGDAIWMTKCLRDKTAAADADALRH